MSEIAAKPGPRITADSEEFWEFAGKGKLMLRLCNQCNRTMYYPRLICIHCLSDDLGWTEASGSGTVYAVTVVHRAPGEAFKASVPYVVAIVELAEGHRMMTNIVGVPPEQVKIGMPVSLVFEQRENTSIPQFTPQTEG